MLALAGPLGGQERARLRAPGSFHAGPNGTELGTLEPGIGVTVLGAGGGWRRIRLEAWIFTASTGPSSQSGFSLGVAADGGENLRDQPNGARIGRALQGALFNRIGRQGGWTRVRREVWVPNALFAAPAKAAPADPGPSHTPPPAVPDSQAAETPPAPRPAARRETGERARVRENAPLSLGPGGAPLGQAPADLTVEVLERGGGWAKVRAEAWVRAEDLTPVPLDSALSPGLAALQGDPDKYIGRTVVWRLQLLAVRVADELRPELPPGRPYLLARGPLPEAGFVYVAVTEAQAERFRRLQPLDEFLARGTVVVARTRYLPTPVLRLQDLP